MGTEGRVTVISGVSGGIGAALAAGFLARGDIVYGGDLAPSDRVPEGVRFHELDVREDAQWEALAAAAVRETGRIDSLVNCAGIIRHAGVGEITLDEWDLVTGVNQLGTWLGMRSAIPAMLERGRGTIVNFSSGWGVTVGVDNVAYQMSKGAILSMTKAVAVEFAGAGIRANAVLPGWTDSPMTRVQPADTNAAIVAAVPLGRGATTRDHVGATLYLTSDDASYVTGTSITVDGAAVVV